MIIIKKLGILFILFFIVLLVGGFYKKTASFNLEKNLEKPIVVYIKDKDLYLDLDDYVIGVVGAEMPASFEVEALKAQAVAARSYIMSNYTNNIIKTSGTINDQVFKSNYELKKIWNNDFNKYYDKVKSAVYQTKNLVVKRNDKILKTYYFSMSNGKTENSETVFKESTFLSVESMYDKNLKNYEVTKEFSKDELLKLFNTSNLYISNLSRNDTGRVDKITINDKVYTGIEIRKLLNLRSTDFDITNKGDVYYVTTRGYGHGVGMSQYGANEMAKQGYSYQEILDHYYQNTQILNI